MNGCRTCKYMMMHEFHNHRGEKVFRVTCQNCGRAVVCGSSRDAHKAVMGACHCDGWQRVGDNISEGNKDEELDYGKTGKPMFWKPEPGEKAIVRVMEPDNIVECVDNTGVEAQFDLGVEYIFEGKSTGDMISVYDKTGVLRECFASRFRVKSTSELMTHMKHVKKLVEA